MKRALLIAICITASSSLLTQQAPQDISTVPRSIALKQQIAKARARAQQIAQTLGLTKEDQDAQKITPPDEVLTVERKIALEQLIARAQARAQQIAQTLERSK